MKRSELPNLDDLRAFEAVARLGSVRAAADELSLTHGAVSRRNAKLSRDMGVALFTKVGRGLCLTADGEVLYQVVSRLFGELSSTVQKLRSRQASGDSAILLSFERSLAMRWLIPRLSAFQDDNPDIAIHLSVGGGAPEFQREGVHLAVRRLDFPVPDGWQLERLFSEEVGPVMAPHLLDDFRQGHYIGLATRTRPDAWARWLVQCPDVCRPTDIRFYDHHFLMVEAASSGLGVALCPKVLACDDIERGRLVAPQGFLADGTDYGLIWPKYRDMSAAAEKLVAWLRQQCSRYRDFLLPAE